MATLKQLRDAYPDVTWERISEGGRANYIARLGDQSFAFPAQGKLEGTLKDSLDMHVKDMKDRDALLPKN